MFRNKTNRNALTLVTGMVLGAIQVPANAAPSWTLRTTDGPSARAAHVLAYDSARGVTVLFGGYNFATNSGFGDTWEWDGNACVQRFPTTSPAPRWASEMVYDSVRNVTVLFGGWDGTQLRGDTWEWDGTTWSLRATTGPHPRSGHKMAFDSARGVTVLFGGWYNHYDGETWEWDGSTWSLRATTGPHRRQTVALAYDTARGVTVLFGGFFFDGSLQYYGDTWEWDGSAWSLRATTGPSPRIKHDMVYDSARGVSVLFGGNKGPSELFTITGETWEWDGSAWAQRFPELSPSPRAESPIVYDVARQEVVLFGGQIPGDLAGDLVYVADTWVHGEVDADGDGVPDDVDVCPDSDFVDTIVIADCDTGVANLFFEDGCTMADRIAQCGNAAVNNAVFVCCIAHLTNEWKASGLIAGADKGAIQSCAAQADGP